MENTMYWLDIDGDRTGLEVTINGIPAERLQRTNGIKFPINEYLIRGANSLAIVRSKNMSSNAGDEEEGQLLARLLKVQYSDATKLSEVVLFERSQQFRNASPGIPLLQADFDCETGTMQIPLFEPPGQQTPSLIFEQLENVARMWREGNGEALVSWMRPYLEDYARAYPLETFDVMAGRVRRMAEGFRSGAVGFAAERTLLEPIGQTGLFDCLSPEGAAVRIERPGAVPYDMWAVVGVRQGKVVLFR